MLVTRIFSFPHNVFYPSKHKFHSFSHVCFVVSKHFQFGPVQNFVVWYWVKAPFTPETAFKDSADHDLTTDLILHFPESLQAKVTLKLQLFGLISANLSFLSLFSALMFNPLPDMPILGSSNAAANKDMMSKIWTNGDSII